MTPPRYSGKKFFIFYTNQLVSLSPWLPLMRELPSIREAEGEKETVTLPLSRLRRQLP